MYIRHTWKLSKYQICSSKDPLKSFPYLTITHKRFDGYSSDYRSWLGTENRCRKHRLSKAFSIQFPTTEGAVLPCCCTTANDTKAHGEFIVRVHFDKIFATTPKHRAVVAHNRLSGQRFSLAPKPPFSLSLPSAFVKLLAASTRHRQPLARGFGCVSFADKNVLTRKLITRLQPETTHRTRWGGQKSWSVNKRHSGDRGTPRYHLSGAPFGAKSNAIGRSVPAQFHSRPEWHKFTVNLRTIMPNRSAVDCRTAGWEGGKSGTLPSAVADSKKIGTSTSTSVKCPCHSCRLEGEVGGPFTIREGFVVEN